MDRVGKIPVGHHLCILSFFQSGPTPRGYIGNLEGEIKRPVRTGKNMSPEGIDTAIAPPAGPRATVPF